LFLRVLGCLLNSAGLIVENISLPSALLTRLGQGRLQVAVLDVWMPVMSGLEVKACLRRDSPETQIIFMSGRDDPSVRRTALDAGAVAFLAKPFEDDVMLQFVRKAVAG